MLETIEVDEVDTGLSGPAVVYERGQQRRMATMTVLFHQEPTAQQPFIQIREWVTVEEDAAELIAEYGYLDEEGDLVETTVNVLPCNWTLVQALAWLTLQMARKIRQGP